MKLPRKPRVENKYNLTIAKIKKLKVGDRNKVCAPLFWRNNVVSAWCISGIAGTSDDERYCTENEYWIGIYDLNATCYASKFRFYFTSYGGMCGYVFKKFYQPADIDSEIDLEVQEKFLEKINYLIDEGILVM